MTVPALTAPRRSRKLATAERTLGSVLKYREDQELVRAAGLGSLVGGAP